jgi:dynein light chain 1, axonemal
MPAEEADYIKLYCQVPPIIKMDSSLNGLRNCEYGTFLHQPDCFINCIPIRRLALSTNAIDRIIPLAGMSRLRILSLGRNQIKKVHFLKG